MQLPIIGGEKPRDEMAKGQKSQTLLELIVHSVQDIWDTTLKLTLNRHRM